ncbi:DUF421 domain-containing protein [Sphingomonas sp. LHG3406-1]|uniref:DUF421 domain-containing protein n=1 Tax=Sphingomonas sp. LHG3406-1 TaxID=2804617 RepID=UPI0026196394|nr:YetF domain-containing protein [Sphingomonas sp. LHG3406-1]
MAPIVRACVLTALAVAWTLLLARIVGLRAFSKATAFDFAATIATGSLIAQAGTRSNWSEYGQAMGGINAIFLVQYLLAWGRTISNRFADAVDNTPVLLLEHGRFLTAAMEETRVTRATLLEKIRMSVAERIEDVRAIVLETTGDIAVMTGDIDPELLKGVRRI